VKKAARTCIRVWSIKSSTIELEILPVSFKIDSKLKIPLFELSESCIIAGNIDHLAVFDIKTGNPAPYSAITLLRERRQIRAPMHDLRSEQRTLDDRRYRSRGYRN
jgi:hypothetical protein